MAPPARQTKSAAWALNTRTAGDGLTWRRAAGLYEWIERLCNPAVWIPDPVTTTPRATALDAARAAQSETRERLLAAAERLFAERGFAGVSVRMIAAEAGVNWSLVGYYFRGKDGLLAEVYRRHCTSLNAERLRLLAEARRAGLRLEAVIEAFVRPALAEIQGGGGRDQFSRLRAMLAAEDAPLFAQLVADNFDQSSRTFVGRAARVPARAAAGRGPVALPLHARHDLLLGEQPAAHQGVLAWTLRSWRRRGDGASAGAVPGGGVSFRAARGDRPARPARRRRRTDDTAA